MSGNKSLNLLIDFSSPVIKDNIKPLIPMPCSKGKPVVSPSDNNPFDVVATQTESPLLQNDPFELVFRTAFQEDCENKTVVENEKLKDMHDGTAVEKLSHNGEIISVQVSKPQQSSSPELFKDKNRWRCESSDNESDISKISIGNCSSIKCDDSVIENKSNQNLAVKNSLVINSPETENNLHALADFTSEEGVKAVIANRVSRCIEKVLNNTGAKKKLNKTTDDLNESKSVPNYNFRRSLSTSVVKKECLNNCNNNSFVGGIFVLRNEDKIEPQRVALLSTASSSTYSSQSTDFMNKGFVTSKISSEGSTSSPINQKSFEDNVFVSDEEQVFNEAKKLANTFSKIANSYTYQSTGHESDEDDLLSCKPEFLYADSSEDEADLLRKDPSLNFHSSMSRKYRSYTQEENSKIDSDVLSRFRNKLKEDKEKDSNMPKDLVLRRSHSWDAPVHKELAQPSQCIPVVATVKNHDECQGMKQLRVKKILAEPSRKGPLKAVVPIQNMTKPVEHKGENSSNRTSPPESVNESKKLHVTPTLKPNSMKEPIAASTPNRNRSGSLITAHVSPIPRTVNKQRQSLDSRNTLSVPSNALMKRSISANASFSSTTITRPKTAIPLIHTNGSRVTENIQVDKIGNRSFDRKKPGFQPKLGGPNPRALSDLTKSPLPKTSVAKASGKLLLKFKKGIGISPLAKDKENRLPV